MAQPNVGELAVAGPLQNISSKYSNQLYIADRIFPIVDTDDPRTLVYSYMKGAWFRDEAGPRGPGARASRGGYPISTTAITTIEYAFAKEVPDEDRRFARATYSPPLQPDVDAIEFCADKIDLSKERRLAAAMIAANWSGAGAGGEDANGLWAPNDATNTFILDVETRIETIRQATGMRPNVLMLSANTYSALKQNTVLQGRRTLGERAIVTPAFIADLFGLEEVLIGDAIYSSAPELATGLDWTPVSIWENNAAHGAAFLFYRASRVGLKVPIVGVQARLRYDNGLPRRTEKWRENAEHQDVYEVAEQTALVAVGLDLGFWWMDTVQD